jgi:hypothetical protein
MNTIVHTTSTISSTLQIEQELQAAKDAGARMETIAAIEIRLSEVQEQIVQEEKQSDISYIKDWSNHYLLKRYAEATSECDALMETINQSDPGNPTKELADKFDASLKLVEQIEDEGRLRGIAPFIPLEKFQDKILRALAELTLYEGFVPARRIAEVINYPTDPLRPHIEEMYSKSMILRYGDDEDLWAVSVATRERLGITKKSEKAVALDQKI